MTLSTPSAAVVAWCERELQRRADTPCAAPDLLQQLTVVVPSYRRQDFLLRQIAHWAPFPTRLVIADGSPEPLTGAARAIVSRQPTVTYLHGPDSLEDRLRLAAQHIRTPYAVFLGDDELLLPVGVAEAIRTLNGNHLLAACIGQSLRFRVPAEPGRLTYTTGYPHWRYDATEKNSEARLTAAMAGYSGATCYAIVREPFWSRSWGALGKWATPYTSELQQALSVHAFGGVTSIDEMYWLRSSENAPVREKDPAARLTIDAWWKLPPYEAERVRFVELVAGCLRAEEPLSGPESEQLIRKAVDVYMDKRARKHRVAASSSTRQRLRLLSTRALRRICPPALVTRLRMVAGVHGTGDLGDLDAVRGTEIMRSFRLSDAAFHELRTAESLIEGFRRARAEDATQLAEQAAE